ncbi:GNAT family N-acetyltransferase [Spongiimicrobium salis]|uniref:GNAT family N-acetyltransferase n=1 Tax=Spongiimicrobium salis TaxID=1667022 RepID=UPI00374D1793
MTGDRVDIRIANKDDVRFIALLGRVTFTETFGHLFRDKQDLFAYCDATFSVRKIDASMQKSDSVYWIAFKDQVAVGYAKLKLNSPSEFINSEKVCQLQKIYVLKAYLSLKIGFGLQNALFEKAKEKGFHSIWLSVLNSNERALSFYRKNGLQEIGQHDFQIGKEKFEFTVMSKSLN